MVLVVLLGPALVGKMIGVESSSAGDGVDPRGACLDMQVWGDGADGQSSYNCP